MVNSLLNDMEENTLNESFASHSTQLSSPSVERALCDHAQLRDLLVGGGVCGFVGSGTCRDTEHEDDRHRAENDFFHLCVVLSVRIRSLLPRTSLPAGRRLLGILGILLPRRRSTTRFVAIRRSVFSWCFMF